MRSLLEVIQLYFHDIEPETVLKTYDFYHCFPKEYFQINYSFTERVLSETDKDHLYKFLLNEDDNGKNLCDVFHALKVYADDLLCFQNNVPTYRFEKMHEWYRITQRLGEDLLICAYIARREEVIGGIESKFDWPFSIGNDYRQLNHIFSKGLCDNHYHLFGSAPAFQMTWLRLMDNPFLETTKKVMMKLDQERRSYQRSLTEHEARTAFWTRIVSASLIRAVLLEYLYGKHNHQERVQKEDMHICDHILTHPGEVVLWEGWIHRWQKKVMNRRFLKGDKEGFAYKEERKLMYEMCLGTVNGENIPHKLMTWFYVYLLIRVRLRDELVQENSEVGFANFQYYDKRKWLLPPSWKEIGKMVKWAMIGSFQSGNLKSLEMRITPQKTVVENRNMIREYDRHIDEAIKKLGLEHENDIRNFFVFHFPSQWF